MVELLLLIYFIVYRFISSTNCQPSINNYYAFAVDYPRLKKLWYVEYNTEEEDRDEVEAASLADRAGLGEVPVGVGVADSAVPGAVKYYFWLQNVYLFTG